MEHIWQGLEMEEAAEGRDAGEQPPADGLKNGLHAAAQARDKCWIHRVRLTPA
jgi:hypothetical protein